MATRGDTLQYTGPDSQMMKPTRGSLPWVHHLKYFDRFIGYRTRQVKVKVIIKNKFPGGDLLETGGRVTKLL